MSITSQLPPISLAQASASLRVLAQAAGQTVEAKVLSQASNGNAQVQVGRQVLGLTLPSGQVVGSTLTLSVQQSDGHLQLSLVAVRPPAMSPSGGAPLAAPTKAATSIELSAVALANGATASSRTEPTVGSTPASSMTAAAATNSGASIARTYGPATTSIVSAGQGPVPQHNASPALGAMPTGQAPRVAESSSGARNVPSGQSPVHVGPSPGQPAQPVSGTVAAPVGAPRANNLPYSSASQPGAPLAGAPAITAQVSVSGGAPAVLPQAGSGGGGPQSPVASPTTPVAPMAGVRPGIPYPVAAPAVSGPQVVVSASSTVAGLPPVAATIQGALVGQHAPSSNTASPPGNGPTASAPAQQAPPSGPAAQQAALAHMVQQALPRQDSIVGLTTALAALTGQARLPEPVVKAAQQVLAARLSLDGGRPNAGAIKAAVQQSGIFQEALLAGGQGSMAAIDLKSGLLALRQTLGAWLGNQAALAQVSSVPPPLRGQAPRAPNGGGPMGDLPDDPVEAGKMLLERTDSALSRLRLHQHASLPDPNSVRQDMQWSMDLPVIVAGQQQLLQMQIQQDAENAQERSEERGWQVRFAINLAERGEVGAQISMRAKQTSVLIWADDAETAALMEREIEELRAEISDIGLVPGAVVVRSGAPADVLPQPDGGVGHVLDASR